VGQPQDVNVDVGLALHAGKEVTVNIFSGTSVLDVGSDTGKTAVIDRILSPLTQNEVGTIRCIGLNVKKTLSILGQRRLVQLIITQYKQHAAEVGMEIPTVPTLFM
jgi:hypothetical protein